MIQPYLEDFVIGLAAGRPLEQINDTDAEILTTLMADQSAALLAELARTGARFIGRTLGANHDPHTPMVVEALHHRGYGQATMELVAGAMCGDPRHLAAAVAEFARLAESDPVGYVTALITLVQDLAAKVRVYQVSGECNG